MLAGRDETVVYDCDAVTIQKQHPYVVVLSTTTQKFTASQGGLVAAEPGEHEFTCQMGMLRGRILVEAAA